MLLEQIWRLASGGKSQEKLNKDCWFVAMKLVALVQSTGKCQMQSLYSGETLPLADFQLEQPVDNVVRRGKELLKVASVAAAYVPTPASVSSLWSSLKDGVFLTSNVQQVEIKTDDDYARVNVVYAAQRSEGYEMSRFGSYLSALSEHEKRDPDMKQLAEVSSLCMRASQAALLNVGTITDANLDLGVLA
ncbi:unnamed protein product [Phytophthora fragariaefolia]|uniref:Unnamed protein product n=1 Tax=Phytophthora fragariaefolia TaxID=1490495 RepID=A0A9W6WS92_9STRA|nr:unnamed protein product [Phytophthora fragariaefolia]